MALLSAANCKHFCKRTTRYAAERAGTTRRRGACFRPENIDQITRNTTSRRGPEPFSRTATTTARHHLPVACPGHGLKRPGRVETLAVSQCASEAKFDPRICSIWPPSGHLFMFTRGSHWWMCAHAGRRTEDQTWHFAKRVTPPNTTSQRRQKWRRKSANSCAATS